MPHLAHLALVVRDYDEALRAGRGQLSARAGQSLDHDPPADYDYGRVAVWKDLYCNLWDLVQFTGPR